MGRHSGKTTFSHENVLIIRAIGVSPLPTLAGLLLRAWIRRYSPASVPARVHASHFASMTKI